MRVPLLIVAGLLASSNPSTASAATTAPPAWRVATLEHVDLWLHGFAMLTSDTGRVTFFARGYKQQIQAEKKAKGIVTQLDANQQKLQARFATNPGLSNAQFLAMYFSSMQELTTAVDFFNRSNGNPRAARDLNVAQQIAMLASLFPQPADREWLRLFVQSIQDEDTRFYREYWSRAQAERGAVFAAINEQWASKYYPKLSRFLNNTQQAAGQFVLSLPLGGEGRTINDGKQSNMIATLFPKTVEEAPEALFVFVHEAVATLVGEAITDNTTPAERRTGVVDTYTGNGAVRSGAVLLQHVAPELVPDYMRFYLRTLGQTPPTGDPSAAFAAGFPLPKAILDAVSKQIEMVLSGI